MQTDSTNGSSPPHRNGSGTPSAPPTGEQGKLLDMVSGALFDTQFGIQDTTRPFPLEIERMLLRDGQAQALERALTQPLKGLKAEIEGGSPKANRLARESLLATEHEGGMKTPLSQVLDQMNTAVALRRAVFEKVWRTRSDGKHVYKKVKMLPVSTTRIVPDKNGTFNGFWQEGIGLEGTHKETYFPPIKSFVYFHDGARYPMVGRSAFQTAYFDHLDKQKIRRLWYIYLQVFALGIRKGRTDSNEPKDHSGLRERIDTVRGGGTIILGPGEELDDVANATSGATFEDAVRAINREMTVSSLLQFLNIGGSEGTGSQSLSEDHHSLFNDMQQGIHYEKEEATNSYLLAPLISQNLGANVSYPRIKLTPIKGDDIDRALKRFDTLAVAPNSNVPKPVFTEIMRKALQGLNIDLKDLEEAIKKAEQENSLPGGGSNETLNNPQAERQTREAEEGAQSGSDTLSKALAMLRNGSGGSGGSNGGGGPANRPPANRPPRSGSGANRASATGRSGASRQGATRANATAGSDMSRSYGATHGSPYRNVFKDSES